ncbi:Ecdysteroid 22-kinase [Operophtera brumata]|uniref:Ecdysteroid 22-kinase n=1 Tax=Operophtera brumata TaxID=104452 RepID=A0A0L7KXS2_OPEBR|nr:Ecdysteroid 22-kinase [Operophtera brumata]
MPPAGQTALLLRRLSTGDKRFKGLSLNHYSTKESLLGNPSCNHRDLGLSKSPVIDLLYLIFTGTDKEFRDKYYEKLVEFYYTQLSDAMKRLGIDPEKTYSREDFYFELKQTEKAPELNSEMDLSSFGLTETGNLYPERINGVVSDFIRWGVLTD